MNVTIEESANLIQIMLGLNNALEGWFGGLLLVMLFFVSLSILITFNLLSFNKSLIVASLFVTILSFLLSTIDMISLQFAFIPMALLIFSVGYELFRPKN